LIETSWSMVHANYLFIRKEDLLQLSPCISMKLSLELSSFAFLSGCS